MPCLFIPLIAGGIVLCFSLALLRREAAALRVFRSTLAALGATEALERPGAPGSAWWSRKHGSMIAPSSLQVSEWGRRLDEVIAVLIERQELLNGLLLNLNLSFLLAVAFRVLTGNSVDGALILDWRTNAMESAASLVAGVALAVIGIAMYFFNPWLRRLRCLLNADVLRELAALYFRGPELWIESIGRELADGWQAPQFLTQAQKGELAAIRARFFAGRPSEDQLHVFVHRAWLAQAAEGRSQLAHFRNLLPLLEGFALILPGALLISPVLGGLLPRLP